MRRVAALLGPEGADLWGADLRSADLTGADLTGANLDGAVGVHLPVDRPLSTNAPR